MCSCNFNLKQVLHINCSLFLYCQVNYINFTLRFKLFIIWFGNYSNQVYDVCRLFQVLEQKWRSLHDLVLSDSLLQWQNYGFFVGDSWQINQEILVSRLAEDQQLPEVFFDFGSFLENTGTHKISSFKMGLFENEFFESIKLFFLEIHFKGDQLVIKEKELIITFRRNVILGVQLVGEPILFFLDTFVTGLDLDRVLCWLYWGGDGAGQVFGYDEFILDDLNFLYWFLFGSIVFSQFFCLRFKLDLIET